MNVSYKKLWNDYGIGALIVLLVVAYGVSMFAKYISSKGSYGYEAKSGMASQYGSGMSSGVQPSLAADMDGDYAPANGMQSNNQSSSVQNPADLLPSEASSSSWAQLNPMGKGELANINLLKAGYHVGINTVGQSLRNANLQVRSEPPNPQLDVGPWHKSTIEPDYTRRALEIGGGGEQL
jgi:hypothetical protein